jgi:hypothetical protein
MDTFATFFLLSFSKLSLMLLFPLYPHRIHNINIINPSPTVIIKSFTDTSVDFVSKEHLPFAFISITLFLFTILPPVFLLALYPFQRFRSALFKCLPKRSRGPLNIFAEKFYSCYRDGLDGGRDMRSLSALYFFVLLISYVLFSINGTIMFAHTSLYIGCSLFIASVQPYKKRYMSVVDSLIFANVALLFAAGDRNIFDFPIIRYLTAILFLLPALGLYSFVAYKLLKKPLKHVFTSKPVKWLLLLVSQSLLVCKGHGGQEVHEEEGNTENNLDEIQLPDRIVHPELYDAQEDQPTY